VLDKIGDRILNLYSIEGEASRIEIVFESYVCKRKLKIRDTVTICKIL
jgi:hypothetical protein